MSQTLEQYRINESIASLRLRYREMADTAIGYFQLASEEIGRLESKLSWRQAEANMAMCRNCGHKPHVWRCCTAELQDSTPNGSHCACREYIPSEAE